MPGDISIITLVKAIYLVMGYPPARTSCAVTMPSLVAGGWHQWCAISNLRFT